MHSRIMRSAAVFVAAVLLAGITALPAFAEENMYENLGWAFSDGMLEIGGIGEMAEFNERNHASSWLGDNELRERTETIVIETGVTSIADSAFNCFSAVTTVAISGTVESIGSDAFSDCVSLPEIRIPVSVKRISPYAFAGCRALKDVYYPGTQEQWAAIEIDPSGNDCLLNASLHFGDGVAPVSNDRAVAVVGADTVAAAGGKTASELRDVLGGTVGLFDNKGDALADDAVVGTGCVVSTPSGQGFVVIVNGDVDGDGGIDATDARHALRAAAKLEELSGAYALAADVDIADGINATDARGILRAAAKLSELDIFAR